MSQKTEASKNYKKNDLIAVMNRQDKKNPIILFKVNYIKR